MIAKTNWFNRRKYSGWGLSPRNWQGFAYIIFIVVTLLVIQSLVLNETLKIICMGALIVFFLIDTLQVMASIKLDEREQKIEAIAERNASWTMVGSSVVTILYVTTLGKDIKETELTPFLIFPIIAGVVAKALSNFIMDRAGV
jgi:hypothetical protein